jgi:hypothetical protein
MQSGDLGQELWSRDVAEPDPRLAALHKPGIVQHRIAKLQDYSTIYRYIAKDCVKITLVT